MTWDTNNKLTQDTVLFDAIGKIRETSDKRREIEARVLAENNLASVRQLSEDKKQKFCGIVDAILENKPDVNTQLFSDVSELSEASAKVRITPWTKADNNPAKNTTFTGASKTNPNKGGFKGGSETVKKNGFTVTKRLKENEDLQELSKKTLGSYIKRAQRVATDKADDAHWFRNQQDIHMKQRTDKTLSNDEKKRLARRIVDYDAAGEKAVQKMHKRRRGIDKAVDKLTKEEIEGKILAMEGLTSKSQLTESGIKKLDAIVEQVMNDPADKV